MINQVDIRPRDQNCIIDVYVIVRSFFHRTAITGGACSKSAVRERDTWQMLVYPKLNELQRRVLITEKYIPRASNTVPKCHC